MGNGQWPKITGKKLPLIYPDGYAFAPGLPLRVTRTAVALRNDAIAYGLDLRAAGFSGTIERDGDSPIWKVQARVDGDPDDPNKDIQNTHELLGNVLSPSNLMSPVLEAQFSHTADKKGAIRFIDSLVDQIKAGKLSEEDAQAKIYASNKVADGDETVALDLLDELIRGVTHYHAFSYGYRHTFNFGTISDLTTDFDDVGYFFTTAEMRDAESIPDSFELPPNVEWLKIYPERVDNLGQRKQLRYEYWGAAEWSRLYYLPQTSV